MFFIRKRKTLQDHLDFHQIQDYILQNILFNIKALKKQYNKNTVKELVGDLKALRDNTKYLPYQTHELIEKYEYILSTELDKTIDLDELIYEIELDILSIEAPKKVFWFKIQHTFLNIFVWASIIFIFSAPLLTFIITWLI